MRAVLTTILLAMVALAGCAEPEVDANIDAATTEQVDCEALLAEHEGETAEEHEGEEEELPEECQDLFVPTIGPLTEILLSDCYNVGVENLVPTEIYGEPPEGFQFSLDQGQVAVISILLNCEEITYRNGTIDDVQAAYHFVAVQPHPDWDDPGTGGSHIYIFGGFTNNEGFLHLSHEFGQNFFQEASLGVETLSHTDDNWVGNWAYDDGGFSYAADIAAGADPATVDERTLRYYWHGPDGEIRVMDNRIGPQVQYIGAGDSMLSSFLVEDVPGAIPGIGFYIRGDGNPLEMTATRPDLRDPSA